MGATRFVSDVCAHSGRPCTSCLPLKTDHCVNQLRAGGTSASVSGDPLMVGSNKKDDDGSDDDGSDGTAHMLPGTNCASDPRYVLDTNNTCTDVDSLPVTLPLFVPLRLLLASMAPLGYVLCFVRQGC